MRRLLLGYFFFFVLIFVGFFIRGHVTADPDFGWHLQTGNYMLHFGVPHFDPFSYTMPSYYFVDHEWLSDVVTALAFNRFGLVPLNLFFAFFSVIALVILLKSSEKKWAAVPLFLIAGTLFEFTGIRMQVLTWVFLALEVFVLFALPAQSKWKWSLPVLFLLWANLHGGFAIGLVVLAIMTIGKRIEEKKFVWQEYLILLLCIGITLLNPYGYNDWVEVSKSFTDTSLRFSIQEWYPAVYFTNIAFWIYFMLSLCLVIRYRKKFSFTVLFLYFFLLLSGLASMRNLPVFVIVSYFPTMQAIAYLQREAGKFPYGKERFLKSYLFFCGMCVVLFLPQLGGFFYGVYETKGESGYPYEAVAYLKQNMPVQNIFAPYDWGGFLIWQLPDKKVFIDGRMPSWKNPTAPKTESQYAFGDYRKILTGNVPFETVSDAYGINTVMIPEGELKQKKVIILGIDVQKHPLLKRIFTNELSFSSLPAQLRKFGWHIVYQDKKVVIFRKPDIGS